MAVGIFNLERQVRPSGDLPISESSDTGEWGPVSGRVKRNKIPSYIHTYIFSYIYIYIYIFEENAV